MAQCIQQPLVKVFFADLDGRDFTALNQPVNDPNNGCAMSIRVETICRLNDGFSFSYQREPADAIPCRPESSGQPRINDEDFHAVAASAVFW